MTTIAEIRSKYPQYNDLSDQQLADALYGKFYSDMDRETYDSRIGLHKAIPGDLKVTKPNLQDFRSNNPTAQERARAQATWGAQPGAAIEQQFGPDAKKTIDLANEAGVDYAPVGTREGDTWAQTGQKFMQRIVPLLKQSGAGIVENMVETGGGAPGYGQPLSTSEIADMRKEWDDTVAEMRRRGDTPGRALYQAATQDLAANEYDPGDSTSKKYAAMIAESFVQMVPTLLTAIATRSPAAGAAVMGTQVGGQQYGESVEKGRDPTQATGDALFMAGAEAIPEMIPLGMLMKPGGKFLARTLNTAGAEGLQEIFTQAVQDGYSVGVLDEKMTWGEARQRMFDAGVVGFGMGAGMSTVEAPFHPKAPVPGIREEAAANVDLTPSDMASPIPNEQIAAGKAVIAEAMAAQGADTILESRGLPKTGTRVDVKMPSGQTLSGIMHDVFQADAGEAGAAQGVKIRMDDGTSFDELFDQINDAGVKITPALPASDLANPEVRALNAQADAIDPLVGAIVTPPPRDDDEPRAPGALPVDGKVTSGFGQRAAPMNGASTDHKGIDIAAPVGSPVRAPAAGTVIKVGHGSKNGNFVVVDHGNGLTTGYAHLGGSTVKEGDSVAAGQQFATSGNTGNSTGPHLHWTAKINGQAVDPTKVDFGQATAPPHLPHRTLQGAGEGIQPDMLGGPDVSEAQMAARDSVDSVLAEARQEDEDFDLKRSVEVLAQAVEDWRRDGARRNELGSYIESADFRDLPISLYSAVRANPALIDELKGKAGIGALAPAAPVPTETGIAAETKASGTRAAPIIAETADDMAAADEQVSITSQDNPESFRLIRDIYDLPTDEIDNIGARLNQKRQFNENTAAFAERIVRSNPREHVLDAYKAETASRVQSQAAEGDTKPGQVSVTPTIEDMPSGKSVIVKGASEAHLAAIKAALPDAVKPLNHASGGVVYSKKHEAKIRAALGASVSTERAIPAKDDPAFQASSPNRLAGAVDETAPASSPKTSAPESSNEDDPRLTPRERAALERLLVSDKKGGEGWHNESSAAAQVRDILDAGRTRDKRDESMLETAQRLAERAQQREGDGSKDAVSKERPQREEGQPAAQEAAPADEIRYPKTLDEFIGAIDGGYRAHLGTRGEGRTMWLHKTEQGWTVKTKDDDSQFTSTLGGAGVAGGWSKGEALKRAQQDVEHHFAAKQNAPEPKGTVPPKATVPIADDRREEKLRKLREMGAKAYRDGEDATPPESLQGSEELIDEWSAGYRGAKALAPKDAQAEPAAKPSSTAFDKNTIFTQDKVEAAKARMRERMNRLNSGVDPEMLIDGMVIAGAYIEAGVRNFAEFAKAMREDFGNKITPYLLSFWEGARNYPGLETSGMTSPDVTKAMHEMLLAGEATAAPDGGKDNGDGDETGLPRSDAGAGASNVQPSQPDGGARRLREGEGDGSAAPVRGTDGGRGAASERAGSRPATEADRGGDGVSDAARLPAGRSAGDPDSRVTGENFTIEPGALDEARGPMQKARDNLAAIEIVKALKREGRQATKEEQAQIARYVGWGGLKGAFPDETGAFAKGFEQIGARLRELLTDNEYATARRSIQYAHYTSETIVREMWRAAERLGFKGGRVFEPGMGTGNFAGMMPSAIKAGVRYEGIEMDGLTADIARALYPRWGVRQADYTAFEAPKDAFDLVIGNPPFSDTVVKADREYRARGFVLHDYFFAKSLDSVRPGGLLMFVTSAGTMNKLDTSAREYLADRAELVGAIRLPGDAFAKNAGTSVTTDIVILRKRVPGEAAGSRAWTETKQVTLPTKDGGMKTGPVSAYFAENSDMVLGEQGFFDKLYPERYAVRGDGADLGKKLGNAIDALPVQVMQPWTPGRAVEIDLASTEKKNGTFYVKDGVLMQQQPGGGRPVAGRGKGEKGGITAKDQERIRALIPIRDALRAVYAADLAENAAQAEKARAELNRWYDAFVAKHGPINKGEFTRTRPNRIQLESARRKEREAARERGEIWDDGSFDPEQWYEAGATLAQIAEARQSARDAAEARGEVWDEGTFDPSQVPDSVREKRPNIDAFMDDPESYRLRAIEHYDDMTGDARKSDVFFKSVVTKDVAPKIESAEDAMFFVLNRTGRVDPVEIAAAANLSPAEVIEKLTGKIFRTPAGDWQTSAKYLSGNVRKKLVEATAAAAHDASFEANVAALRAVIPADLGPSEVRVTLGMPWIGADVVSEFGRDGLGLARLEVTYQPVLARWFVSGDRSSAAATSDYGTNDRDATQLMADAMNGQSPKVYDTRYVDGKEERVLNPEKTQAAVDKMAAIKARFQEWIWSDDARAERLLRKYNDEFNNLVAPQYDGSYLTTPGISAHWSWRPHQRRVVARILQDGNTYIAHAVGAGKTSEAIGAAMEMKRLGLVNKPMFVVPNHMLAQFTKEFYEQYPLARIMVADDSRNFIKDKRKQFVADMAVADLDAVIIKHSAFEMIPLSHEFQQRYLRQDLDELRSVLAEVKAQKGEDTRITRAKIEGQIEKAEQRLRATMEGQKDQTFSFEETGVDFLFVDEAHLFRKLDFSTSRGQTKGIDPKGSMASLDLFMKTRMLEERRPGRSHVLMSGTPITNTMAELFTISRYLQPAELASRGIDRFDAWAASFGDVVTDLEQQADGSYKAVPRFSRFVNVPELSAMVRQIMDVVTPAQLGEYVVRPKATREMVVVEQSEAQEEYRQALTARMKIIQERRGKPAKGDDIMLTVINDGRHAAIDMRLVDPTLPADPNSKLERLIDNVHRIWKETRNQPFYKITAKGYSEQPIDRGPAAQMIFSDLGIGGARAFNVHKHIVDALVLRGVPRNEIVLFNNLTNDVQKQRVFNDVNAGKVRILIGSVPKMGTGVNAQRRLIANHNLDPQWYPANDEQRNGRIIRQGNMNPEVTIYDYSTEGTYDSTMWGLMARKAKFIEGFFRGDPALRDMDDLGEASQYEQAKALTTSDPRILALTEAQIELEKELRRKAAFERNIITSRRRAADAKEWAARKEMLVAAIEKDVARRQNIAGDAFSAKIGSTVFDDRKAFQEALANATEEQRAKLREGTFKVGEIGGFDLIAVVQAGRKADGTISELTAISAIEWTPTSEGQRYKPLAFESPAVSAQMALAGLDKALDQARADAEKFNRDATDFEARANDTSAFPGEARIAELSATVQRIEAQLTAEADQRAATVDAPTEDAPKLSIEVRHSGIRRHGIPDVASRPLAAARPTLSPRQTPTALRAKLTERLAQHGLTGRVALDVVDAIAGAPEASGIFRAMQRLIEVSLGKSVDPTRTLDHEIVHAMRKLGIIRDIEWKILAKSVQANKALMDSVRARYAGEYAHMSPAEREDALIEEAVADSYAEWVSTQEAPKGFIRAAFQRIRAAIRAIGEWATGTRLDSAEAIMRAMRSGALAAARPAREVRVSWASQDRKSIEVDKAVVGEAGQAYDGGDEIANRPAGVPNNVGRIAGQARFVAEEKHAFSNPDTEARFREATKGIGDAQSLLARVRDSLDRLAQGFSRHWQHLPNVPAYAGLQQKLRTLEAAPQAARERTVRMLTELTKGFTKDDLDLLARKVILDDLMWEAEQEHALPFGLTPETLRIERARVDAIVAGNEMVGRAVLRRKVVNRRVAQDLVDAGVLEAERIKNPAYFRHQVLEYARAEASAARAPGNRGKLRSPKWAKRMGSDLDINANLLEAEFDWLTKAFTDIPSARAIEWISGSEHNILPRLKQEARENNRQALAAKMEQWREQAAQGDEGAMAQIEAEKGFRRDIAVGFKFVSQALEQQAVYDQIPAGLLRAADGIIAGGGARNGESAFPLLSWMLDNNVDGSAGAAMILKAVSTRRMWTASVLGRNYIDPGDIEEIIKRFAPDGYSLWSPEDGLLLFTVKTVPEHLIDKMIDRLDAPEGIDPAEFRAYLRKTRDMLAVGSGRYKMVLPDEVVATLNQLRNVHNENLFTHLVADLQAAWKRWVLINPRRVIKYNLNNLSGDLDAVIAGNPRLLRRVPQAVSELARVARNKAVPSQTYLDAVDRGVFDSGLSIQEIPEINSLSQFEKLTDANRTMVKRFADVTIGRAWRALQGTTQFRENVFRYAAYLDYVDRIEAGEPMAEIGYGASLPEMVDAVVDKKDKAALLARELVGDYGAVSAYGQDLRRYLIPFFSWMEINTKRYWRLIGNAGRQGIGKGLATGTALAAAKGARTSVWLAVRMGLVFGAVQIWNHLMFPDEEDDLGEQQKRQLHLVLGRDGNGEVVTLRLQGALSDFLSWFGFADVAEAYDAYEKDRGSMAAIFAAPGKTVINKVGTAISPLISLPLESATEKKLWPDLFQTRFIRDRWRNLFQTFSLENEYDLARGKPSRGYDRSWVDSVVYRRHPGEIAYQDARGDAYEWLRDVKGQEGGSNFSTPRSVALYDWRKARLYGDSSAEDRAIDAMAELGMTQGDLNRSIKRAAPLGPIAKKDQRAYVDSLDDEQYDRLLKAQQFYEDTFLDP